MTAIERVGIVGCGTMGAGLAEICARAGLDVLVALTAPDGAERGRSRVQRSLDHGVRRGRLTEQDRDTALSRIAFTADFGDLSDRQLLLEAVPEREPLKIQVFETLDKVARDPEAILASNTSSIPIMKLGCATERPGQVIGLHFFNPAPVLPLVEVVNSLFTTEDTRLRAGAFATDVLGKQVITAKDRPGFVVNSLLVPYLLAAVRMVESGFASAEDVDLGMTLGCAHPMGPLALVDLIGLDVIASIAQVMHDEFKDPSFAPPPLLLRMVEGRMLGKKTGRGFHAYG
jgi:3-hydroxybutyryl-CoA dehydrogenase